MKAYLAFIVALTAVGCAPAGQGTETSTTATDDQASTALPVPPHSAPTVRDLLAANDPAVCVHPEVKQLANSLLEKPDPKMAPFQAKLDSDARAHPVVRLVMDRIAASGVDPQVHTVRCTGVASFSFDDGTLHDAVRAREIPVRFEVTPSLESSASFLVTVEGSLAMAKYEAGTLGAAVLAQRARREEYAVSGPGFDCMGANLGFFDRTVCEDKELSELDRTLAAKLQELVDAGLVAAEEAEKAYVDWQLQKGYDCGPGTVPDVGQCMKVRYRERIAALAG